MNRGSTSVGPSIRNTLKTASAESSEVLSRLLARREEPREPRGWGRWLLTIGLILALAWTISLFRRPVPSLSLWDFRDPQVVLGHLTTAVAHYAVQVVLFIVLGLALPVILRGRRPERSANSTDQTVTPRKPLWLPLRVTWYALYAVLFVLGTAAVSACVAWVLVPTLGLSTALDLGAALWGVCLGIAAGRALSQGWLGARRLLWQGVVTALVCLLIGKSLFGRVAQGEPYDFPAPQAAQVNADREPPESLFEHVDDQDGQRVVHLSEDQLNKMLTRWVTFQSAESHARVALGDTDQTLRASLRAPEKVLRSRPYLNVTVTGRCEIADEHLDLELHAIDVGSLHVPGRLVRQLGTYIARWINNDPANADLLASITAVMTRRDGVDVFVAEDFRSSDRFAKLFQQFNDQPDQAPAVREYLNAFLVIAQKTKPHQPVFDMVVRRAFELARERSVQHDAAKENRAAIIALGIALGTTKLGHLVGDVAELHDKQVLARLQLNSRLRKRTDWPRHFWVSAALTVMASGPMSDMLGLLKEELDGGEGGSGFSFGDLTADRAGTTFAALATRDVRSAEAVQQWVLAPGADLQMLMPVAYDLPENLPDAEFVRQFDGVDGPRYQAMLREIESRIAALPWNKNP